MKQALRSSGANTTEGHIRDVSLGAMFLMQAASTAHTVRDATADVSKMAQHLMEQQATNTVSGRKEPLFTDPTEKAWTKLSTSDWLQGILERSTTEDLQETDTTNDEVDLDYKLYN